MGMRTWAFSIGMLAIVSATPAQAGLWEDVDSFSSSDLNSVTPEQMTIDSSGRMIVVLAQYSPGQMPMWGVRISDGQGGLKTVDSWQLSPGKWAYANGVA